MTRDDVLFGYRQQLFAEAARRSVSAACRTFGVHRSTYYVWKRQVDRHGCRHGLNTRSKRLALIAGYAAPYEPPRDPGPDGISTSSVPASWLVWTASSSAA